jgi:preprotein translocase subunit SecG
MFTAFIIVLHIIVCVALILIILLQSGKGADIGAVFGGGSSQTVFGSSGATTFLSKITIAAAVIFMITSIVLTYFSGRQGGVPTERSIMEQSAPQIPEAPSATESEAQKSESAPAPSEGATKSEPAPTAAPTPAPAPASQAPPAQPSQNR